MLRVFLNSLEPNQDLLLSRISTHITDDMLAEIAQADYGRDCEKHLAPLRLLRDQGVFSQPMHWYPCEVLELVRHSRGHWIGAFANAALLRAMNEPWNYSGSGQPSYTLIKLLSSLEELPIDFTPETVRLVSWMMLNSDLEGRDAQPIYLGVALLWLTLQGAVRASDQDLVEIADWVVRHEAELHTNSNWAFDRWLLGIAGDPPPSEWERLGEKLAALDLSGRTDELRNWVKLIGDELAGNSLT